VLGSPTHITVAAIVGVALAPRLLQIYSYHTSKCRDLARELVLDEFADGVILIGTHQLGHPKSILVAVTDSDEIVGDC
jgi:hypothetical protein